MSRRASFVVRWIFVGVAASLMGRAQTPGAAPQARVGMSDSGESNAEAGLISLVLDTNVNPPEVPQSDLAVGVAAANELPLQSRDVTSLGLLASTAALSATAAGVTGDEEADSQDGRPQPGAASAGLSERGIAATQGGETLDGLSGDLNYTGRPRGTAVGVAAGGGSATEYGQSAMRSLRILPQTFSASAGGGAGTMLAITSRSGSGAFHAAVFVTLRTSALAAANPFSVATQFKDGVVTAQVVKPGDTLLQFGGHIDAPLGDHLPGTSWRGKVLGFASIEELLQKDQAVSSPAAAGFYQLSAEQLLLLGNRGVTAADTNDALDFLDGLSGNVSRSATRNLLFGRLDVKDWGREHVALTYARNRLIAPAGAGYGAASDAVMASGRGSVGDSEIHVDSVAAHWLHSFSPSMQHELRAQWVRDWQFDTARIPLAQEPAIGPGGFAPQVTIGPEGYTYGTPANLGKSAAPDEHRVQLANTFAWLKGKHLWMAGGDWSWVEDRVAGFANPDGSFLYDSGVTGGKDGGLADWITDYSLGVSAYPSGGCPSVTAAVHYACFRSFTESFGELQAEFVTHLLAGYLENAWRLRDDLWLSAGVRYEYALLPLPQAPNEALDAALSEAGPQVAGATSSFPEDRNNVGPRLGAAWSPGRGKVVTIHVGYGVFYGKLTGATVKDALVNTDLAESVEQVRIRPTTETVCPQNTSVGFGYPCDYITTPTGAVAETGSAVLFAKNFRLPAVQRASLLLERDVGRHGMVRVEYTMAVSTQLPTSVDVNIAPTTELAKYQLQVTGVHKGLVNGETFVVPLYTARRLTQYGQVTALVSGANATYHGGTVEAEMRGWHGLAARGSFTFSRSIDYAPQLTSAPVGDGQFDPFTNGYDKGLSSLQFPERFAGFVIWRVRMAHGPEWMREVVSGWRVASIGTAGSGGPYSYEISGGTYLSGGRESINGSGGATYLPTVGRNTLRLPAHGSVDAKVERGFRVRAKVEVSAFVEAFNVLNTRNLTRVETRAFLPGTPVVTNGYAGATPLVFQDAGTIAGEGLTTPAFGTAVSSTSGVSRERQVEVGLRVEF